MKTKTNYAVLGIPGDHGKSYRQAFLNQHDRDRKQERNTKLLLIAASLYIGGHIAWYLINLLVEAV